MNCCEIFCWRLSVDRSLKLCQCHWRSFNYDVENGAMRYRSFPSHLKSHETLSETKMSKTILHSKHPAQSFPQIEEMCTSPHIRTLIAHTSRRTTEPSMVHTLIWENSIARIEQSLINDDEKTVRASRDGHFGTDDGRDGELTWPIQSWIQQAKTAWILSTCLHIGRNSEVSWCYDVLFSC